MGKPLDVFQRLGSPVNKVCAVGRGGGGEGGRVLRISSDRDDRMGAKKIPRASNKIQKIPEPIISPPN